MSFPNINPRNNILSFFVVSTGLNYTATIPIGRYIDPLTVSNAITLAMNTAVGSTMFTCTQNPLDKSTFTLEGLTSGGYHFIDTSPAVIYKQTYNFPSNTNLLNSTSYKVGPMFLDYSKYLTFQND